MFTFMFIKGDPLTALKDRNSVVLTEKTARKYFGSGDPLNKILKIENTDFLVTGVIENIPANTFLQFDIVFPIANMEDWWGDPLDSWKRDFRFNTFIQLDATSDWRLVSKKLSGSDIVRQNYAQSTTESIFLQPMKDIHLHSAFSLD